MLRRFCLWLSETKISVMFQTTDWFVPLVQTIHIIAISVLLLAVYVIGFRLVGLTRSKVSLATIAKSSMPWIWISLFVLLMTGTLLTITEPARELLNNVFRAKMIMVLLLAAMLLLVQSRLRSDPNYWAESASRRLGGRAVGIFLLLAGMCIVTAGRWIAYV